ncbi:MAG: prepilin-type N-terminal cleavage/methylation domain-containing protein [Desulfotomaculaceae bacterium]|nr:prepilin-type N-terminal cleavage/methylation domain-containing protein [Desulfotomaculaceae bacterium]
MVKKMVNLRDESGFTLIELMLSLLLMSILFLTVWGVFASGVTFWKQAEYKVDMCDSLRISLDRMGRELMYTRKPAGATTGGVQTPSDNTKLYFINAEGSTISYYLKGYELMRKEYTIPQPLASDIQNMSFTYYNRAGKAIDSTDLDFPGAVDQVKIELTAKKYGSTISPVVLVKKVTLRSL